MSFSFITITCYLTWNYRLSSLYYFNTKNKNILCNAIHNLVWTFYINPTPFCLIINRYQYTVQSFLYVNHVTSCSESLLILTHDWVITPTNYLNVWRPQIDSDQTMAVIKNDFSVLVKGKNWKLPHFGRKKGILQGMLRLFYFPHPISLFEITSLEKGSWFKIHVCLCICNVCWV